MFSSGPNDHVFVNFVDHGATGMIGFPGQVMMADDLLRTLQTMYQQQMYKKVRLVQYFILHYDRANHEIFRF